MIPRDLALVTAKRYISLLKKHYIPVLSAWFFVSNGTGKPGDHHVIEIAIVLDPYPDEPGKCLPFMKLRRELDLRIEPYPIDKKDFESGNLFVDMIKATGRTLM
ncbi:MAG: hypothetical protein WCK09_06290 [Bacteroidota bacterium]